MALRTYGIWAAFTIAICCAVPILVYQVRYTQAGEHFDVDSLEFQLFKNSYYAACDGAIVDPKSNPRCPLDPRETYLTIQGSEIARDVWDPSLVWFNQVTAFTRPINQSHFCDCFRGWKILPTQPTGISFQADGLSLWLQHTMMAVPLFWTIAAFMRRDEDDEADTHIKWYAWPIFLYDIISCIMWFRGYTDDYFKGASIFAWITAVRYAFLIRRNPIRDRIKGKFTIDDMRISYYKIVLGLVLAMGSILFIMTASNVSFYENSVAYLGGDLGTPRALLNTDYFDAAPGKTTCSASQLQQFAYLSAPVKGVRFAPTRTVNLRTGLFAVYAVVAGLAGLYEVLIGLGMMSDPHAGGYHDGYLRDSRYTSNFWITPIVVLVTICEIIVSAYVNAGVSYQAGTSITYDIACTTLTIAPSPYRGYLDVAGYNVMWRTVRSWFNV